MVPAILHSFSFHSLKDGYLPKPDTKGWSLPFVIFLDTIRCIPYYKYKLSEKSVNIILTAIIMNKFACESKLDKPFPPNVYNTLSLRKGRLEENDSPTSLK